MVTMTVFRIRACALFLCVVMIVGACGATDSSDADDVAEVDTSAQSTDPEADATPAAQPEATATVEMIPVEPDGGIGDGAGPPPGFEDEDASQGSEQTWHGAVVAETNCPGMTFQRVDASVFSFSVPSDFVDQDAQPLDSEIGYWQNPAGSIEVSFDYGWYSGPLSTYAGAEVQLIDFSGFAGEHVVIRNSTEWPKPNMVGVHFGEVALDEPQQWNALNLVVQHDEPADEIIGRCIVDSIEWKIAPGE